MTINTTYRRGLRMIVFILAPTTLLGCSTSTFGQDCSYPEKSYPDGKWERLATLYVQKPYFLFWSLQPKFGILIRSDDGRIEYDQEWPVAVPPNLIEMDCVWETASLVSISVEKGGGGQVHPDLPTSTTVESTDEQWVLRTAEP